MSLHDLIVKEFERTKSLSALIYLIEHGREIEFLFEGNRYFLSRSNSQKRVSLWSCPGQEEQSFDTTEELIEKATMRNDVILLDSYLKFNWKPYFSTF